MLAAAALAAAVWRGPKPVAVACQGVARGGPPLLEGLDAGRLGGGVGEAALVLAVDEADVALLAPRRTPRVLDGPVVLAAVGAGADEGDTVVELLAAAGDVISGDPEDFPPSSVAKRTKGCQIYTPLYFRSPQSHTPRSHHTQSQRRLIYGVSSQTHFLSQ